MKVVDKMKKVDKMNKYIVLLIAIVGLFLVCFCLYLIVNSINNHNANSSYLVRKKLVTKSYKIEEDLTELKNNTGSYFVYISYTGDEDIYDLEKELKPLIKQYKLKDKFYYVNIDSLKDDTNKVSAVNELLGLNDVTISKVPTIYYVNNGTVNQGSIITRLDDNLMEAADFQQLLDINDF